MTNVAIIGAGHNGLVCAFYLARAGLSVTVLEANAFVGGASRIEELFPRYRFSTCANILGWMRPRVVRDMRLRERGLEAGGDSWRFRVMHGHRGMAFSEDEDQVRAEIARVSKADSAASDDWNAMWRASAELLGSYLLSYPPTLGQPHQRARDTGSERLLEALMTSSLAELCDRYFESNEMRGGLEGASRHGHLYDHGSAFVRGLASAAAWYSETGETSPAGYVRGGMGRVTELMAEAVEEQGARVRTNASVRRVVVENGRARGVELDNGEQVIADVIISNADVKRTFRDLLADVDEAEEARKRVRTLRSDVAPMKLHCAMNELPEFRAFPGQDVLGRGNVMIQLDREHHEGTWDDARNGRVPKSPVMIFMRPSVWDPRVAPEGKHTVSIWMHFAPVKLVHGHWAGRREEITDALVETTRLAYVEVLADEKAVTASGFLRRAIAFYARHGITVERVMTDNGGAYRSAIHAFACRALGIRHLRTRPHRPRTDGKAERFIRTLLAGWAYGAIYGSSQERTASLDGWLWTYNHRRPHGALSHKPPITRLHELNNLAGSYI